MSDDPVQNRVRACCQRAGVLVLSIVACAWALASMAAPAAMDAEVTHLLARMESSGCEFYRNGTWASGATARAHLERKYRALRDRQMIATTEEFIERGASRSSMSGEAYRVRCGQVPPVESGVWFGEQLRRYRAGAGQAP
jgi:hypothetical protein